MRTSKKVLIVYLTLQMLSVGCAHQPRTAEELRFAAESFQRAADSANQYFEPMPSQRQQQRQPTSCRPDHRGGMVCY